MLEFMCTVCKLHITVQIISVDIKEYFKMSVTEEFEIVMLYVKHPRLRPEQEFFSKLLTNSNEMLVREVVEAVMIE